MNTTMQTLREALERAQQDINWMLNSRQFLKGHVFDYIDVALSNPPAPEQASGEQNPAAKHWHDLYVAKCQELNDERARLGV